MCYSVLQCVVTRANAKCYRAPDLDLLAAMRVVVCCSVLQGVAVCCSVLQCVVTRATSKCHRAPDLDLPTAVRCNALHCAAVCSSMCCWLRCVAACCSVLQRVAACCSVLQYDAVCCSVLQAAASKSHPTSNVPPVNESRPTYIRVMSQRWTSHIIYINETHCAHKRVYVYLGMSLGVVYPHEWSCVSSRMELCILTNGVRDMRIPYMNDTYCAHTRVNDTYCAHTRVPFHIWTSHVACTHTHTHTHTRDRQVTSHV